MDVKKSTKASAKDDKRDQFSVAYHKEKLRAIRQYSLKKGVCLEAKGAEFLDSFYAKVVPKEVRAYIEDDENTRLSEP